ncbi:carbonic anhydrase 1-like [Ceratina calcarata]|uniref:Carbonic anhydrase 1-like n=1 Tax=Ceratina calcarata TaxID=156304 RepID=A0AAJ7WCU6_9HYME|nr:carbonic anhydrase 1-like [Ceratina calcarata]
MEEIVKNLLEIRTTDSSVRIAPSSLTNFLIPFTEDYFLYWGSIITISNIHSILWLICREPIGITTRQVAEFRKLHNQCGGPILSNVRQRKPLQGRDVFHVCPSGSLYASLLPVPRIYDHGTSSLNRKGTPSNEDDAVHDVQNP